MDKRFASQAQAPVHHTHDIGSGGSGGSGSGSSGSGSGSGPRSRQVEYSINVMSQHRDTDRYPSESYFELNLPQSLTGLEAVRISQADIPPSLPYIDKRRGVGLAEPFVIPSPQITTITTKRKSRARATGNITNLPFEFLPGVLGATSVPIGPAMDDLLPLLFALMNDRFGSVVDRPENAEFQAQITQRAVAHDGTVSPFAVYYTPPNWVWDVNQRFPKGVCILGFAELHGANFLEQFREKDYFIRGTSFGQDIPMSTEHNSYTRVPIDLPTMSNVLLIVDDVFGMSPLEFARHAAKGCHMCAHLYTTTDFNVAFASLLNSNYLTAVSNTINPRTGEVVITYNWERNVTQDTTTWIAETDVNLGEVVATAGAIRQTGFRLTKETATKHVHVPKTLPLNEARDKNVSMQRENFGASVFVLEQNDPPAVWITPRSYTAVAQVVEDLNHALKGFHMEAPGEYGVQLADGMRWIGRIDEGSFDGPALARALQASMRTHAPGYPFRCEFSPNQVSNSSGGGFTVWCDVPRTDGRLRVEFRMWAENEEFSRCYGFTKGEDSTFLDTEHRSRLRVGHGHFFGGLRPRLTAPTASIDPGSGRVQISIANKTGAWARKIAAPRLLPVLQPEAAPFILPAPPGDPASPEFAAYPQTLDDTRDAYMERFAAMQELFETLIAIAGLDAPSNPFMPSPPPDFSPTQSMMNNVQSLQLSYGEYALAFAAYVKQMNDRMIFAYSEALAAFKQQQRIVFGPTAIPAPPPPLSEQQMFDPVALQAFAETLETYRAQVEGHLTHYAAGYEAVRALYSQLATQDAPPLPATPAFDTDLPAPPLNLSDPSTAAAVQDMYSRYQAYASEFVAFARELYKKFAAHADHVFLPQMPPQTPPVPPTQPVPNLATDPTLSVFMAEVEAYNQAMDGYVAEFVAFVLEFMTSVTVANTVAMITFGDLYELDPGAPRRDDIVDAVFEGGLGAVEAFLVQRMETVSVVMMNYGCVVETFKDQGMETPKWMMLPDRTPVTLSSASHDKALHMYVVRNGVAHERVLVLAGTDMTQFEEGEPLFMTIAYACTADVHMSHHADVRGMIGEIAPLPHALHAAGIDPHAPPSVDVSFKDLYPTDDRDIATYRISPTAMLGFGPPRVFSRVAHISGVLPPQLMRPAHVFIELEFHGQNTTAVTLGRKGKEGSTLYIPITAKVPLASQALFSNYTYRPQSIGINSFDKFIVRVRNPDGSVAEMNNTPFSFVISAIVDASQAAGAGLM